MIKLAYLCASSHGEFRLKPISLNPSFLMQSEVDIMQQCTMVWYDSGCFVNSHSYKKIGHQFILHQSCYKSNSTYSFGHPNILELPISMITFYHHSIVHERDTDAIRLQVSVILSKYICL